MKVGYVRVSTAEQNTQRQEVILKELNVEKLFIEKTSGKNMDRPQLKEMMAYVREGDTVFVESISRFARNTKDLLDLMEQLKNKGVAFVSRKEAIDTTTPTGKFMLTVFGAVAEFEREYIHQRQLEGIAIAKAQGLYKGRRKITSNQFEAVYTDWKRGGVTAVRAMVLLGMKRNTFYRRVNEFEHQATTV